MTMTSVIAGARVSFARPSVRRADRRRASAPDHHRRNNASNIASKPTGGRARLSLRTRGAVETLFIGLRHMSEAELNRRVVCLDCDTLYFSDVLGQFRGLPKENGACFYFVDQGSRAMYSYLRVGADDLVKEVREKNAISRMANVGAYGFPSARALREYIQAVLDQPDRMMETYYVSNIINKMVRDDFHFAAINADHCRQCGTPPQLEEFMAEVAAGQALQLPKRRFCFALDNVLVSAPLKPGDFATVQPIEKNVQLVRELKQSGHHITISTCREIGRASCRERV